MTKKQMRKLAKEIAKYENIHENSGSEDEKLDAEQHIFSITEQILCLPHGMEILEEVDEIAQKLL